MPKETTLHELRDAETGEPIVILLVDDDELAVRAVERALGRIGLVNTLRTAYDGVAGLKELECGETPLPSIALLDLHMPKMGGLELLKRVREAEALRDLIVYVLSSSNSPLDVEAARRLGAVESIPKGIGLAERLNAALLGGNLEAIEVARL